ncbi:MAG: hypothetical protein DYG92_05200 [Leptolyngbya sp. PLA1]|nr:hypothetical protein [Leptolyngbya sp. PLA1]
MHPIRPLVGLLAAATLAPLALAQPGADICANAPLITPGLYSGTTVGSTPDGNSGCGAADGAPDVWYKIVAPSARLLVVDTCTAANYDSVLALHSGCAGGVVRACNDDSCGLQSRVEYSAAAGETIYIRVSGFAGGVGTYTMSVAFQDPPPPPTNGPDVSVFQVLDIDYYATVNGINAYAVGTDSCNVGDAPVSWYSGTPFHPVIAQNMFRLKAGRFEQIGMSWLKHGFASTNSPGCGTCVQPPDGGAQLGIACTDAYGAGLNGSQGLLGPRSDVNAATGVFPWPFTSPSYSGDIARRLQVRQTDVNPANNAGAVYFVDTHYVTQDDAQWNNGLNNLSYRRLATPPATGVPNFAGSTQRFLPGIHAWRDTDSSVTLANADYIESYTINSQPRDITCRFIVGSKVTSNQDGTYTYEYAVHNINSHRSGGSFSVPVAPGLNVTNIGFHDVDYHSGEPYDNTDWTVVRTADALLWSSPQTHAQNPNSNALRWSTLYNFRFTVNAAPQQGDVSIGLFRPGTPAAVTASVDIPLPGCDPDVNQDGNVDQDDVAYLTNVIGGGANPTGIDPDFNRDGNADQDDIAALIDTVGGGGCP